MGLIIENVSGTQIEINDLGFGLAIGASIDLTIEASPTDVTRSGQGGELQTLITSGTIIVKDPSDNNITLSIPAALDAVRTHNDTHYRMPIGGRIADAIDVDLSATGSYLTYNGTMVVRNTPTTFAASIPHNSLSGLTTGDPHTQYVKKAGDVMTGSLTMSSGSDIIGTTGSNVRMPAGTPANPSYTFSADQNSGMYSPSADVVSISAGGSNVVSFSPITTTLSTELQLSNFPSTRNDGPTTSALYVDASGNLRHGTINATGGGSDVVGTLNQIDVTPTGSVDILSIATDAEFPGSPTVLGDRLTFAPQGIGLGSGFIIDRTNDRAGIWVTEVVTDGTRFQFYMADNPVVGNPEPGQFFGNTDSFELSYDAWYGPHGQWNPVKTGNLNVRLLGHRIDLYGPTVVWNTPFYTGGGTDSDNPIDIIAEPGRMAVTNGALESDITFNPATYNGNKGFALVLRLTAPNQISFWVNRVQTSPWPNIPSISPDGVITFSVGVPATMSSGGLTWGTIQVNTGATITVNKQWGAMVYPRQPMVIEGDFQLKGGSPAAGRVLTSDAVGNASWQDSTPTPVQLAYYHNGATTQTFTTGYITVNFASTVRQDTDYNIASGVVTISQSGTYEVDYQITSTIVNSNSRVTSTTRATLNNVEIAGTLANGYHRSTSNGANTVGARFLINIVAGAQIRIQSRSSSNVVLSTVASSCRLNIRRVD